jgi:glutaredoxin
MPRVLILALVLAAALGAHRWKRSHQGLRGTKTSIVLYSVTGCRICQRMRGWLEERHLAYRDRDATALTRDDLLLLSRRSPLREFPQLEIGGHFFTGGQEDEAKEALDAVE